MNMGEKIKRIRKAHNMTQEELASKIGVSTNSVHRYEHGTRNISFDTLEKIASVFGMSIEEVACYDDSKEIGTITKEVYREYFCKRLEDLTDAIEDLPQSKDTLNLHLEMRRDIDYIMQQLYLLDNEE